MLKISQRDMDKKQKAVNDIRHIREALKKEPIVIKMLKENDMDINDIDDISISFADDLDVSAKTINGKIYLNAKMLDENWKDYFHYAIHEITHAIQHRTQKCSEDNKEVNYLDNPAEVDAFKVQLQYRLKTEPREKVLQYLRDLFDKHDIPADERPEKRKELMGK